MVEALSSTDIGCLSDYYVKLTSTTVGDGFGSMRSSVAVHEL